MRRAIFFLDSEEGSGSEKALYVKSVIKSESNRNLPQIICNSNIAIPAELNFEINDELQLAGLLSIVSDTDVPGIINAFGSVIKNKYQLAYLFSKTRKSMWKTLVNGIGIESLRNIIVYEEIGAKTDSTNDLTFEVDPGEQLADMLSTICDDDLENFIEILGSELLQMLIKSGGGLGKVFWELPTPAWKTLTNLLGWKHLADIFSDKSELQYMFAVFTGSNIEIRRYDFGPEFFKAIAKPDELEIFSIESLDTIIQKCGNEKILSSVKSLVAEFNNWFSFHKDQHAQEFVNELDKNKYCPKKIDELVKEYLMSEPAANMVKLLRDYKLITDEKISKILASKPKLFSLPECETAEDYYVRGCYHTANKEIKLAFTHFVQSIKLKPGYTLACQGLKNLLLGVEKSEQLKEISKNDFYDSSKLLPIYMRVELIDKCLEEDNALHVYLATKTGVFSSGEGTLKKMEEDLKEIEKTKVKRNNDEYDSDESAIGYKSRL